MWEHLGNIAIIIAIFSGITTIILGSITFYLQLPKIIFQLEKDILFFDSGILFMLFFISLLALLNPFLSIDGFDRLYNCCKYTTRFYSSLFISPLVPPMIMFFFLILHIYIYIEGEKKVVRYVILSLIFF